MTNEKLYEQAINIALNSLYSRGGITSVNDDEAIEAIKRVYAILKKANTKLKR